LAGCGSLLLIGGRKLRALEIRHLWREKLLRGEMLELTGEVAGIRRDFESMQQKPEPPAANSLAPGLRIQAVRRIQRGGVPADIAAELRVPRNQIELLIKVQRVLANPKST
jgi:hypothetical protein